MAIPHESASALTYRRAGEADVPALDALWSDDAGWGGLTLAQWREWYEHTPYGPCLVSVAVQEDGQVIGQLALTPARVIVGGVERKAIRLSAPILRSSLRRPLRDLAHPVVQLYVTSIRAAMEEGVELVYTLPDRAWVGFFRWLRTVLPEIGNFQTATFACRALPVDALETTTLWQGTEFSHFDGEFDEFWTRAGVLEGRPTLVRRAAWLQYKLGGSVLRVALRDGTDTLVGYAAVRESDGLLLDALVVDPTLYAPLLQQTAVMIARARAARRVIPARIQVMETDMLREALDALGAEPVDFTFALAIAALPGGPASESVAPERWLICGGD